MLERTVLRWTLALVLAGALKAEAETAKTAGIPSGSAPAATGIAAACGEPAALPAPALPAARQVGSRPAADDGCVDPTAAVVVATTAGAAR